MGEDGALDLASGRWPPTWSGRAPSSLRCSRCSAVSSTGSGRSPGTGTGISSSRRPTWGWSTRARSPTATAPQRLQGEGSLGTGGDSPGTSSSCTRPPTSGSATTSPPPTSPTCGCTRASPTTRSRSTPSASTVGRRGGVRHRDARPHPERRAIVGTYGVNARGSGDMYPKGGNMLHTIRHIIGDDARWTRSCGAEPRVPPPDRDRPAGAGVHHRPGRRPAEKVFEQYLTTTRFRRSSTVWRAPGSPTAGPTSSPASRCP